MPAYFESGVFGSNTPAWHGEGVVVAGAMTAREALRLGGLDWTVEKRPLYLADGTPVQGAFAIVRIKDGAPLGVVGDRYLPVQNEEAFSFLDALVGSGQAVWDTAISVKGGRIVAGLVSLGEAGIVVRGQKDRRYRYLTIINSHDGTAPVRVFPTDVRVVCANTVALATSTADRRLTVSIRHTGDINHKREQAAHTLAAASEHFQRYYEWLRALAEIEATPQRINETIDAIIPEPPSDASKRALNGRERAVALLTAGLREEVALLPQWTATGGGPSAYELWNAVTRAVDHGFSVARKRKHGRFEYAVLSKGNDLKAKAARVITHVFDVPVRPPMF